MQLVASAAQASFSEIHSARERAYGLSREIVRSAANSIRATHRGETDKAHLLLDTVVGLVQDIEQAVKSQPSVYHAGFVEDAQQEYVEAAATLAFTEGTRLPGMDELNVGPAPYLGGLADTVGELRRYILDSLRKDDYSRCEELLGWMDDVYTILVSIDFPEAVTRGLRRKTDMARGALERTQGDLTVALRQRRLERRLAAVHDALTEHGDGQGAAGSP